MAHDRFLFVTVDAGRGKRSGRGSAADRSAVLSYAQVRRREREKRENAKAVAVASPSGSMPRLPRLQCPAGNGTDPFYCTSAGRDGSELADLRHGLVHAESTTLLAESFAPMSVINRSQWSPVTQSTLVKLRRCVADPTLMYATLAYGSSYIGWIQGRLDSIDRPAYFVGKTLQLVRARLDEQPTQRQLRPADTDLMLAVHALAVTDLWNSMPELWRKSPAMGQMVDRRRLEACRTHIHALCFLVECAGGWANVSFMVLKAAILVDKSLALYTMAQPVIPFTWDPGRWPGGDYVEALELHPRVEQRCDALVDATDSKLLQDIIRDINDYTSVADRLWSQDSVGESHTVWLFLRLQALTYRLLLLPDLSQTDQCICLTTFMFLFLSTNYLGADLSARHMRRRLETTLMMGDGTIAPNVLFWCACTAAMVDEGLDHDVWLIQVIIDVCEILNVGPSMNSFRAQMDGFLFNEERQGVQLARVIRNVSFQAVVMSNIDDSS